MPEEETKNVLSFQDAAKAREEQEARETEEIHRRYEITMYKQAMRRAANPKWYALLDAYPNNAILKKIYWKIRWREGVGIIFLHFNGGEAREWFLRECEVAFEALEYPLEDGTVGPKMLTEFTNPKFFAMQSYGNRFFNMDYCRILEMPGNKKFMHMRMKDGSNHFKMPI